MSGEKKKDFCFYGRYLVPAKHAAEIDKPIWIQTSGISWCVCVFMCMCEDNDK